MGFGTQIKEAITKAQELSSDPDCSIESPNLWSSSRVFEPCPILPHTTGLLPISESVLVRFSRPKIIVQSDRRMLLLTMMLIFCTPRPDMTRLS